MPNVIGMLPPQEGFMRSLASIWKIALYLTGVGVLLAAPAAEAQFLRTWKTVRSEETGVSISLPPKATVELDSMKLDPLNAKATAVMATGETASSAYMLSAIRLDQKAVDELRIQFPNDPNPIKALFGAYVSKELREISSQTSSQFKVTRKPLAWRGMNGEEYILKALPAARRSKPEMVQMRILYTQDRFFMIVAVEKQANPESAQRISHFFQSFALTPNAPPPRTPSMAPLAAP